MGYTPNVSATQHPVSTIGHSNHSLDAFLALLRMNGIEEVVDVRSTPHSRFNPHFSRNALARALDKAGIAYVFAGGELGGRPSDRTLYDADGRVRYEMVARTASFDTGIRRVMCDADQRRIVLLCAEKEPLDCHRTLLVGRALVERGVAVQHILADGRVEVHAAAMDRLLAAFRMPPEGDMLHSRDEAIAEALDRQANRVAYTSIALTGAGRRPPSPPPPSPGPAPRAARPPGRPPRPGRRP